MNIACPECSTVYRIDPDRVPAGGVAASCRECDTRFRVDETLGPTEPGDFVTAPRVETAAVATGAFGTGVEHTEDTDAEEPAEPLVQEISEPGERPGAHEVGDRMEGESPVETEGPPEVEGPVEGESPPEVEGPVEAEGPAGLEGEYEGREAVDVEEERPAAVGGEVEPEGPVDAADEEEAAPAFGPQDPETRARRLARALVSDIKVYHPEKWEEAVAKGTLRAEFRDEILKSWDEYVEQVGEDMAKKTPYFRDALNEILARGEHVF